MFMRLLPLLYVSAGRKVETSPHRDMRRLFQMRVSSTSRFAATRCLIRSSQANILIMRS
jgi:hypothetical protein